MGRRSGLQFWGVIMVAAGVLMLLGQMNLLREEHFLYYLSGGFIVVYLMLGATTHYGNIGFLIPGCVLFAISVFANLEENGHFEWIGDSAFFFFLSLAFIGVYLHTMRFRHEDWGTRNWPLFPAGGLLLFGCMILLIEHTEILFRLEDFQAVGAVILIVLGGYFWLKGAIKRRRRKVEENGQERGQ